MAVVNPGDCFLIRYNIGGNPIWHERVVVATNPANGSEHYIVTPDEDEYREDVTIGADVAEVLWLTHYGAHPPHVPGASVYRFANLPDVARRAELAINAYRDFGVALPAAALAWDVTRNAPVAPPPVGLGALRAALGAGGAAGGGVLAPAPVAGPAVVAGALAPVAPAAPVIAPVVAAVAPVPAVPPVATNDARVMAPVYDALGNRFNEFRNAVQGMQEYPWPDWPVPGPRTVFWLCNWYVSMGFTPTSWFGRFKADGGLSFADEGVESLERDTKTLQIGICFDQLNAANVACLELVARSIQVTAYSYRDHFRGTRDDSYERSLMYGSVLGDSLVPVSPALSDHISAEMAKRNAREKERRKAQENREASGSSGGRGGGRDRGRGRGRNKGDGKEEG